MAAAGHAYGMAPVCDRYKVKQNMLTFLLHGVLPTWDNGYSGLQSKSSSVTLSSVATLQSPYSWFFRDFHTIRAMYKNPNWYQYK